MFSAKSIEVSYDNGVVHRVQYLGKQRLRWTCVAGPDEGASAEETYQSAEIASDIWMLHWVSADGTVVTQVIQPKRLAITTTIATPAAGTRPGQGLMLAGRIRPY